MTETRQCTHCGKHKPLTLEYWYYRSRKDRRFKRWCQDCIRLYSALYRRGQLPIFEKHREPPLDIALVNQRRQAARAKAAQVVRDFRQELEAAQDD